MFVLNAILLIVKLMAEKMTKKLFLKTINGVISFKESEKEEYQNLLNEIVEKELSKKDVLYRTDTLMKYLWFWN